MNSVDKRFEGLIGEARRDESPQVDVRHSVQYRLQQQEVPSDSLVQWLTWGAIAVAMVAIAVAYPYMNDVLDPMGPMIYQAYSDGF